ncbi:hypothetical protein RYD26_12045 [Pasteurellaceae bacterium LIM206]|nr:hypothetical protein [Pasteurellaceae bacterium LIM206]
MTTGDLKPIDFRADYWGDLGRIRLQINVGFVARDSWATAICVELDGFTYQHKWRPDERVMFIEEEVRKCVKKSYRLIDSDSDFYTVRLKIAIADQVITWQQDILKTTWQRLYPWQRITMLNIWVSALVEWEFERIN